MLIIDYCVGPGQASTAPILLKFSQAWILFQAGIDARKIVLKSVKNQPCFGQNLLSLKLCTFYFGKTRDVGYILKIWAQFVATILQ